MKNPMILLIVLYLCFPGADAVGSGSTRRTFTVNGTLNDDATITVSWSYVLNSGATPASPAQGMYKLKAIGL